MIILTILNSVILLYLIISRKSNLYITFERDTLVGYDITLWKNTSESCSNGIYTLHIPLKNKNKVELSEEVSRLINGSMQNKRQALTAKFSWLKTWEEVRQFEKNYSVVDTRIVENLVSGFVPKSK